MDDLIYILVSLNDTIESITGIKIHVTVLDSVLDQADEVIVIDLSPEGARAMEHGIYPAGASPSRP